MRRGQLNFQRAPEGQTDDKALTRVSDADTIENGRGRVKVGDGVWEARGLDAPAGAHVRVTGADGTCLRVEGAAAIEWPGPGSGPAETV